MPGVLLPIITIVLCSISFSLLIRDEKKNTSINKEIVSGRSILPMKALIYSIIMIVITVGISIVLCLFRKDVDFWSNLKKVSLLTMLWPIAYTDFKCFRIPNSFILLGLAYRVVILPFELLFNNHFSWMTLLSEGIAAAALFVAAILCSLCIKNSIGYGDMKLFIVMGLLLSLDGIWGAIFLSLIISFILSAYLLITKKKSRKDSIPFGPAIVLGTYLSVCLSGM